MDDNELFSFNEGVVDLMPNFYYEPIVDITQGPEKTLNEKLQRWFVLPFLVCHERGGNGIGRFLKNSDFYFNIKITTVIKKDNYSKSRKITVCKVINASKKFGTRNRKIKKKIDEDYIPPGDNVLSETEEYEKTYIKKEKKKKKRKRRKKPTRYCYVCTKPKKIKRRKRVELPKNDLLDPQIRCCITGCKEKCVNRTRYSLKLNHFVKPVYKNKNLYAICHKCYFKDLYKSKKKNKT